MTNLFNGDRATDPAADARGNRTLWRSIMTVWVLLGMFSIGDALIYGLDTDHMQMLGLIAISMCLAMAHLHTRRSTIWLSLSFLGLLIFTAERLIAWLA